ncbi:MAG TPA: hypothetical protein VIP98_01205 [Microlunatus sp.]
MSPTVRRWRAWAAPAVTVLITAAAQPLLLPLWMLGVMAAGTYDASGRGGPFRACTADSTTCTGPVWWMIAAVALVLLAACAVASMIGIRVGGYRRRRLAFVVHWMVSAVVAVASAAVVYLVAARR